MSSTELDLYREVSQIFRTALNKVLPDLRAETTTHDIDGWNSFKYVEILVAVEEKYGFDFEPDEIDGISNVGDLIHLILAKRAR